MKRPSIEARGRWLGTGWGKHHLGTATNQCIVGIHKLAGGHLYFKPQRFGAKIHFGDYECLFQNLNLRIVCKARERRRERWCEHAGL
jgi:hypothetical protein